MEILLPELGEGIKDVEIRDVLVSKGDPIKKDQTLLVLETEKASMEIPSDLDGMINEIFVKKGDIISPGQKIFSIEILDDKEIEEDQKSGDNETKEETDNAEKNIDSDNNTETETTEDIDTTTQDIDTRKVLASPSTRKLARDLGCDISLVTGSGEKGRITKQDVLDYVNKHLKSNSGGLNTADLKKILKDEIASLKDDIIVEINNDKDNDKSDYDFGKWGLIEQRPLTNIQKATGKNMTKSWKNIPQVTQFDSTDITHLYQSYKTLKKSNKDKNIKVSIIPFYIRALCKAIKLYPTINSSLSNDGSKQVVKKYINVGVAVDTIHGLVVPVIKNCEKKSLKRISSDLTFLAERAHKNNLTLDEISGGSITISSLGGIGGTYFTPIVVPSQAAILGFSKADEKPYYINNQIQNKLILPFSISYDHRLIDGATAARFTVKLSDLLSR